MADEILTETHPWKPYVPQGARIMIMGTFPPPAKRWSMEFFYPNRTNDFWPMMGLLFFGDREALVDRAAKTYRLGRIMVLLDDKGIAMGDTALIVRRLRGNASDKYLDVVEPFPLQEFLKEHPTVKDVAATGEKAAGIAAALTSTALPGVGDCVAADNGLRLWRMPSTSRAYPLALEKKAAIYGRMFEKCGILDENN